MDEPAVSGQSAGMRLLRLCGATPA